MRDASLVEDFGEDLLAIMVSDDGGVDAVYVDELSRLRDVLIALGLSRDPERRVVELDAAVADPEAVCGGIGRADPCEPAVLLLDGVLPVVRANQQRSGAVLDRAPGSEDGIAYVAARRRRGIGNSLRNKI